MVYDQSISLGLIDVEQKGGDIMIEIFTGLFYAAIVLAVLVMILFFDLYTN
jgi:hypothetical protein